VVCTGKLQPESTICTPFSSQLIMSDFSSLLTVLCLFFTWIAVGDVDLCFVLLLVVKAIAVEEETR
jgi:hypothetical protein